MILTVAQLAEKQGLAMVPHITTRTRLLIPIQLTVVEVLCFGFAVKSVIATR